MTRARIRAKSEELLRFAAKQKVSGDEIAPPLIQILWAFGVEATPLIFISPYNMAVVCATWVALLWWTAPPFVLLALYIFPRRWLAAFLLVLGIVGVWVERVVLPWATPWTNQYDVTRNTMTFAWHIAGMGSCGIFGYLRQTMLQRRLKVSCWDDLSMVDPAVSGPNPGMAV